VKTKAILLLLILLLLAACGRSTTTDYEPLPAPQEDYIAEYTQTEIIPDEIVPEEIPQSPFPTAVYSGFVDERFELISLIFRLAGRHEHSGSYTPYQEELSNRFREFNHHGAVMLARAWNFGFDAVLGFAIHMERTESGFTIIDTNDFIANDNLGRWDAERIELFIAQVNDFYLTSDFATFFRENVPYFLEHSEMFHAQLYGRLNKYWFYDHGIHPGSLRAVITPGTTRGAYASRIYDDYGNALAVYGTVPGVDDYNERWLLNLLVHEFSHAIGNPIAARWYEEDENFRQLSNRSIDMARMPFYPTGMIMAGEYVTRAYTILYMVENEGINLIFQLLNEKAQGFPYIGYVYYMVTGENPLAGDADVMELVLGTNFEIAEEELSFEMPTGELRWRFVYLHDGELDLSQFWQSEVGNVFDTTLGEVLYVILPDGRRLLYIDLGYAGDGWSDQHRSYAVFPLD